MKEAVLIGGGVVAMTGAIVGGLFWLFEGPNTRYRAALENYEIEKPLRAAWMAECVLHTPADRCLEIWVWNEGPKQIAREKASRV